ncbi:GntR family transcriptional regulator [Paracoccus sp. Z118]|uniref:GntR family transcriptional regulator n=1 Tax=Paracoccus sp. Z118 TaxID=2851017 RepID=UPI001C2C2E13|nr:GntR family transcriptional regulator [Paracoccus sp. Z118]MBV0893050.1 GntR family transcriptional regulator [Paracoccus sp. Z118]
MNDLTADDGAGISERIATTLHGEVLSRLRDHVVHGDLPDGARISERELCARFGVSRTPLREALKVLASEGLIELLPNRGARVKSLTPDEIGELFDLMGGLEALAGRLACERITPEQFDAIEQTHREMYAHYLRGDRPGYFACNQRIHEAILAAAGNGALSAAARALLGRLRRVRFAANLDEQGDRWREAVREHELILHALCRRAGAELADLLFNHLRSTRSAILRNLAARKN